MTRHNEPLRFRLKSAALSMLKKGGRSRHKATKPLQIMSVQGGAETDFTVSIQMAMNTDFDSR